MKEAAVAQRAVVWAIAVALCALVEVDAEDDLVDARVHPHPVGAARLRGHVGLVRRRLGRAERVGAGGVGEDGVRHVLRVGGVLLCSATWAWGRECVSSRAHELKAEAEAEHTVAG